MGNSTSNISHKCESCYLSASWEQKQGETNYLCYKHISPTNKAKVVGPVCKNCNLRESSAQVYLTKTLKPFGAIQKLCFDGMCRKCSSSPFGECQYYQCKQDTVVYGSDDVYLCQHHAQGTFPFQYKCPVADCQQMRFFNEVLSSFEEFCEHHKSRLADDESRCASYNCPFVAESAGTEHSSSQPPSLCPHHGTKCLECQREYTLGNQRLCLTCTERLEQSH
jgi:hypothetical protein